jgi:hypothetical protein
VRDNPAGASAYTIKASRVKLSTFALSGGIAALGGALLALALQNIPLDRFFTVQDSLILVSIVVIGGLGSVVGPILGSLWVIGLPAFFPGNEIVPLLSSSVGLLILLLYFPGGLVQLGYAGRDALFEWMAMRVGPVEATPRSKTAAAEPVSLVPGTNETAWGQGSMTTRMAFVDLSAATRKASEASSIGNRWVMIVRAISGSSASICAACSISRPSSWLQ